MRSLFTFKQQSYKLFLCYQGTKVAIATRNTLDCFYLKELILVPDIKLIYLQMHSCEGMSLLPWQQDFHSNKYYSGLLFPHGTCVPNIKLAYSLQTAKLSRYVSVAMVTGFPGPQAKALVAVASRDLCTKYEVHLPSNSKDISMSLCCYGNKVSIATSNTMDSCCLKGFVCQVKTSYTFKQRSYKHKPLLPLVTRFP